MVDVKSKRCLHLNCSRQPGYGAEGGRPLYCSTHKESNMVDVKDRRCEEPGCKKHPTCANAGERPRFCAIHKLPGMIDVKHKRCEAEGCVTLASFGRPEENKRRFCSTHKLEGMKYITHISRRRSSKAADQAPGKAEGESLRRKRGTTPSLSSSTSNSPVTVPDPPPLPVVYAPPSYYPPSYMLSSPGTSPHATAVAARGFPPFDVIAPQYQRSQSLLPHRPDDVAHHVRYGSALPHLGGRSASRELSRSPGPQPGGQRDSTGREWEWEWVRQEYDPARDFTPPYGWMGGAPPWLGHRGIRPTSPTVHQHPHQPPYGHHPVGFPYPIPREMRGNPYMLPHPGAVPYPSPRPQLRPHCRMGHSTREVPFLPGDATGRSAVAGEVNDPRPRSHSPASSHGRGSPRDHWEGGEMPPGTSPRYSYRQQLPQIFRRGMIEGGGQAALLQAPSHPTPSSRPNRAEEGVSFTDAANREEDPRPETGEESEPDPEEASMRSGGR
ncbi:unnamed protein product [Chrysoparadoxa australica]